MSIDHSQTAKSKPSRQPIITIIIRKGNEKQPRKAQVCFTIIWATYHEWLMNLARLPFLVASIDSYALRDMINASFKPAENQSWLLI